jgi:hypothetical protein
MVRVRQSRRPQIGADPASTWLIERPERRPAGGSDDVRKVYLWM